jgi:hypothetical protein
VFAVPLRAQEQQGQAPAQGQALEKNIAVPLQAQQQGAVTHVLVAVATWSPFQRIVDEAEAHLKEVGLPTGYAFVFDSGADRIIAHKLRDPMNPRANLLNQSVTKDVQLPQLVQAATEATGRAFEYDYPPGNRKFAVFRHVETPTRLSTSAFDWRLGIGVDYSDIFAPLARLRNAVILATLAITGAVALVGVWLGRSLSLSVKEFSHLATEAAAGRFDLVSRAASHDEISELSAAMNRLFVSMRSNVEVQPVPNPYVVGTPVRSASMFYGRQEDTEWIRTRLLQAGNELIMLYGPRRIGKTSLLHCIRTQRETMGVVPIFIDTHALLPVLRSDTDFYAGLGRTIAREAGAFNAQLADRVHTADDLVEMLHALNTQFPNHSVALLFDEVEALDMKVREETLTTEISSFLASLLESGCRVSMLTTGSNDGSRMGGPFWSLLASKAIARRIGLLSRAEGLRLITEPVAGHVEFEDGVPETILRLSGAHPYYTQTICQRLIDTLNERHTRVASRESLRHVVDQLLAEPPLPLDDMWSGSSALQRWILAELARLLPDSEAGVNADALLVGAQHAPTEVVAELRRFTTMEVLEEAKQGYRFPVDFMRLWIRKEQLWWQVANDRRTA